MRKRRNVVLAAVLLVVSAGLVLAHDMFLKPEDFFTGPNREVLVRLLNGTFSQSENSIARERLLDVSVVSPAGRERIDTARWNATGDTSSFRFTTGGEGTYVLGTSTRANIIPLEGKDFNEYLASDGVPDVLEARRKAGELGRPARERYAKHVKALLQVGEARSEHFGAVLGYPAEIVPLTNPYTLKPGATLEVRITVGGQPVANQYVLYGGRTATGGRIAQRNTRSDAAGVAKIPLSQPGTWYVKFIHMQRLTGDSAADYESTWGTLSFAVK